MTAPMPDTPTPPTHAYRAPGYAPTMAAPTDDQERVKDDDPSPVDEAIAAAKAHIDRMAELEGEIEKERQLRDCELYVAVQELGATAPSVSRALGRTAGGEAVLSTSGVRNAVGLERARRHRERSRDAGAGA